MKKIFAFLYFAALLNFAASAQNTEKFEFDLSDSTDTFWNKKQTKEIEIGKEFKIDLQKADKEIQIIQAFGTNYEALINIDDLNNKVYSLKEDEVFILQISQKDKKQIIEIKAKTEESNTETKTFIFYLNDNNFNSNFYDRRTIESGIPFKIKLNNCKEDDKIIQGKGTLYEKTLSLSDLSDKKFQLENEEKLDLAIERKTDSDKTKTYAIQIAPEKEDTTRNTNFLFVSLIKSIAGTNTPDTEFFDIHLKFNFGKRDRFFSLLGLDVSLSTPSDSSISSRRRLSEASINFNWFSNPSYELKTKYDRAFFIGGGLKVFNTIPYMGFHIGNLEIGGPFYSSYFLAGYYHSMFPSYARYERDSLGNAILENAMVNEFTGAVKYNHNVYAEVAFCTNNKIAGILSNLRIKVGLLMPFAAGKDEFPPSLKRDMQTRIVLEVPIGGIFKFGSYKPTPTEEKEYRATMKDIKEKKDFKKKLNKTREDFRRLKKEKQLENKINDKKEKLKQKQKGIKL